MLAHLIAVVWISVAGTSPGAVRYYHSGLAGLAPTAMDEYPEVGTWPARIVEWLTPSQDAFVVGFVVLSLLVSALFTVYLWRGGPPPGPGWGAGVWGQFAAGSGPIFLTRLDIFPGILVAGFAAMLFAGARYSRLATVLLAVATMMKLWPGVLGAALVGGFRRAGTWVRVAWFLASLVVLCLLVVALGGTDRLLSPLTYQGDRGLQVESIGATPFMLAAGLHDLMSSSANPWTVSYASSKSYEIAGPGVGVALTVLTLLTAASILLALGWALRRLLRDDWTPGRAVTFAMMLIMLIIVTNKVFSPQYLAWIAPIAAVALLVSRRAGGGSTTSTIGTIVAVEILVAALLTTLVYPVFYDWLIANPPDFAATVVLALRNVVVLVLTATCAWWALRPAGHPGWSEDAPAPADSARAAG
ncbi:MAG: hypothetical protein L0J86_07630 [Corynebacterium sp.]|nr:hypothetical protein [Corynebacterium sp.]